MIAKIPPKRKDGKSSFRDAVNYCLGDAERVVHANSRNIRDIRSAALEMMALASDNVRCKDPVFHFILSWRENEFPTNEQADEAVGIALKELDLQDCQAVWALQNDTENRHAHVIVNRIDPESGKAIQPAGNWTYKALERAARKIEMRQGWEIEKTGRYLAEENELKEREGGQKEARTQLSQTARDIEAHTGRKSAERIGQEMAIPVVRAARTWKELHERLAEQGIAFLKQGSGAVLWINHIVVKASKIDRAFSVSKLEKRLGPYQERDKDAQDTLNAALSYNSDASGLAGPIEKIAGEPKVKASWERYQKEREEYLSVRKNAFGELAVQQKAECGTFLKEQKKERTVLFEISWKGKGTELNRRRSLMAAEQQKAKLNFRDRQEKERKKLKARFPYRFLNFKTWLNQDADPELSVLFRYSDGLVFSGGEAAYTFTTGEEADLRAYTATGGNKGGVAYIREKKKMGWLERLRGPEADFIDYGRKILLSQNCGETAILAALQLASQKWGAVQINGSEEYKRLCVRLAAKHNIRIANPELKAAGQEGKVVDSRVVDSRAVDSKVMRPQGMNLKKTPRETTVPEAEAKKMFERYADAVGAERYRVVATEFTAEGVKAFIFDKRNGGLDGKTRGEILEAMPQLQIYVKYSKNICVAPLSADKHHILIDDMTGEKLRQFKDDGYSPACVIESSPGNFQAILSIPKTRIAPEKEREAANRLVRELNRQYGDPKLSGAVHAHRLPPFPNLKPKHKKEDGTFPATVLAEADGGMCRKAARQLEEIRERERKAQGAAFMDSQGVNTVSANARDPNGAYWAHCRDIVSRESGTPDYSRIDGMIGMRMRVTGYGAAQIYEAIKANAPAMRKETMNADDYDAKYHHRDWGRFAGETVEKFVFGSRGMRQYSQAEAFRAYYMKVESRDFTGRDLTGRNWTEEARRKQAGAEKAEKNLGR